MEEIAQKPRRPVTVEAVIFIDREVPESNLDAIRNGIIDAAGKATFPCDLKPNINPRLFTANTPNTTRANEFTELFADFRDKLQFNVRSLVQDPATDV